MPRWMFWRNFTVIHGEISDISYGESYEELMKKNFFKNTRLFPSSDVSPWSSHHLWFLLIRNQIIYWRNKINLSHCNTSFFDKYWLIMIGIFYLTLNRNKYSDCRTISHLLNLIHLLTILNNLFGPFKNRNKPLNQWCFHVS